MALGTGGIGPDGSGPLGVVLARLTSLSGDSDLYKSKSFMCIGVLSCKVLTRRNEANFLPSVPSRLGLDALAVRALVPCARLR